MDPTLLDSPTLRTAAAVLLLTSGQPVTTRELSERLGITTRGARYCIEKLSTLLPIIYDDGAGAWRLLRDADLSD